VVTPQKQRFWSGDVPFLTPLGPDSPGVNYGRNDPKSTNMTTTSDRPVINYEQHKLEMLLWQAHIHEKNGENREASKIRAWVTDFLSEQSKVVRSVWRRSANPELRSI
jgi:hypothetical protein